MLRASLHPCRCRFRRVGVSDSAKTKQSRSIRGYSGSVHSPHALMSTTSLPAYFFPTRNLTNAAPSAYLHGDSAAMCTRERHSHEASPPENH